MSEKLENDQPSRLQFGLSVVGIVAALFMFAFIILIAYLPTRPEPVDQALIDQRLATLAEVNSEQHDLATTYGWVDQNKEIVRIPIEQAMKLTVRDLGDGARSE